MRLAAGALLLAAFALPAAAQDAALVLNVPGGESLAVAPGRIMARAVDNLGGPAVEIQLAQDEAKLFGALTERNIGKVIEIRVCGEVLSAPVVREAIVGGKAVVTGSLTRASAKDLVRRIQTGDCKGFVAPEG